MTPTNTVAPTTTQPNIGQEASQFGDYSNWAKQQLQGGATTQDLKNYFSQNKINYNSAPQPQSHGNWFERLLPTIGGIGGGILGSLTDAFTGPLGTIGGSGIGGALGQELENALTGSKGSTMASGLENAAGGLLGDIGGGILGKVIGKGADVAENTATSSLMRQFGGNLSREDTQALLDKGLTSAQDVRDIAPELTGSAKVGQEAAQGGNAAYHTALINKLDSAPNISISDLSKNWMSRLEPYSAELSNNPGVLPDIQRTVQGEFNNIASTSGKDLINTGPLKPNLRDITQTPAPGALDSVSPRATFDSGKKLVDLGYTIENSGVRSPAQLMKANILKDVGQSMKNLATGDPSEIGSVPLDLTTEDKQAIIDGLSNIKKINPKVYEAEVGKVNNASTWSDINNSESLWVRAQKALDNKAAQKSFQMGQTPLDVSLASGSPKESLTRMVLGAAKNSDNLNKAETSLLSKGSKVLGSNVVKNSVPLMTRAAITAAANLPNIAQSGAGTNNVSNNSILSGGNNQQGGNNMIPGQQSVMPLSTDFQALMNEAQAAPSTVGGQLAPLLSALAPLVQKQQMAAPILANLESMYNNAGGAQGMGGGLMSEMSGLIPGTAANLYQREAQAASGALSPIMGTSPQTLSQLMPSLMANQPTAGLGFGNINSLLGALPTGG